MRIIAVGTLREFWSKYPDAEQALKAWFREARSAGWVAPQDIKNDYRSVSFIAGNRAVFNIGGNKYRLIVKFHYNTGIGYIRFIGTHAEYDKIDAETI